MTFIDRIRSLLGLQPNQQPPPSPVHHNRPAQDRPPRQEGLSHDQQNPRDDAQSGPQGGGPRDGNGQGGGSGGAW